MLHNPDLNSPTPRNRNSEFRTDRLFYPQAAFILYMEALLSSSAASPGRFFSLFQEETASFGGKILRRVFQVKKLQVLLLKLE